MNTIWHTGLGSLNSDEFLHYNKVHFAHLEACWESEVLLMMSLLSWEDLQLFLVLVEPTSDESLWAIKNKIQRNQNFNQDKVTCPNITDVGVHIRF